MKLLILNILLLFCGNHQLMAKGLMLSLQYYQNEKPIDLEKLAKGLSDMEIDIKTFVIDDSKSIEEYANRLKETVRQYHEQNDTIQFFVITDRESSFVGLELASVEASVKALLTICGAFNDGDRFLYGEMSFKKNMEMLDSISFDGSKERYLEKVFKMIADKKTGKRIRLPKNADNDMAALYALLESNYGSSIMRFSLDSCLSKISAAVFPIYDSDNQQLLDVDYLNLCLCGNKYQVRYSYPICYSGETLVKEITKSISELLTK